MGIFSKQFGTSSDIKKELEDLYLPIFQKNMGMPPVQAKRTFLEIYQQAEEEAKADGSINLPLNLGDILLEKESTDEKISIILSKKRNEGVKDEDIRWWLNMHELERKLLLKIDEMMRAMSFIKYREDGLSIDEATIKVKKFFPIFGNLDDSSTSTEDDRPLPFELKDRINKYIEHQYKLDAKIFKEKVEILSSFNALIRNEIRKGNL